MLYLASYVFPFIAIACGVSSLIAVVSFIKEIAREIHGKDASNPNS